MGDRRNYWRNKSYTHRQKYPINAPYPFRTTSYPEDVMQLGEEIPLQWINKDEGINSCISIVVPEVIDPSCLWVVLVRNREKHMDMMGDIMAFYTSNENVYKIPVQQLFVHMYVIVPGYNRLCRAKILYRKPTAVYVYLIDTGLSLYVRNEDVSYLHKNFATLPAQAIRAKLFNLIPYQKKQYEWATKELTQSILYFKFLVGIIREMDIGSRTLELVIIDGSDETHEINVNSMLRDVGHAELADTTIE